MKIGIVGLGLIGGTYADSLRSYNYDIVGIDIDPEAIEYALKNNLITTGSTNPAEVLGDLDVVFMCLYPKATVSFIKQYINNFKRGAIISDVVGIKRKLIDQLEVYFDDDIEFVFSHPIAGREKSGVKYSDKAIFHNANFVITPTKKNTDEALNLIETLAKQMGFKQVSRMKDYEHDDIIAYTSQLTHAIAISLVNSDTDRYDTGLFIGDSYKDLTRIAMINESLWTELFLLNKDFLVKRIEAFEKELDRLKDALATNDVKTLESIMRQSTKKRGSIK